jgi:nitrate reductase NapAB chaperone NapD
MMKDKDPARTNRVMEALLKMEKIEIRGLEEAYGKG